MSRIPGLVWNAGTAVEAIGRTPWSRPGFRAYALVTSHEFDVQRQRPFTPEGQIQAAGRFSREASSRFGADRTRRVVGRTALAGAVLLAVMGPVTALT